jgi:hypothetical protein
MILSLFQSVSTELRRGRVGCPRATRRIGPKVLGQTRLAKDEDFDQVNTVSMLNSNIVGSDTVFVGQLA